MKKYLPILTLLLLLTACQREPGASVPTPAPTPTPVVTVTPTPEPTPTPMVTVTPTPEPSSMGIELDVGDGEHKFWVEITQREEQEAEGGIPILVSVYEESSGELKQSFEDEVWLYSLGAATPREVDVNFDGCMDFEYGSWIAASSSGSVYYVWDKEAEQFVRDPYGLENLAMPDFDQERQVIETWNHSGFSYTIEFYRYLDGKLTCVRRLKNQDNYSDDFTATLTVENYDEKIGTLKEVYREENAEIGGVTYASTEEFQRWHDLDYHGD